jgi:hypothetical protein
MLVSCSSQLKSADVAGRRNHPFLLRPLVPGTSATLPLLPHLGAPPLSPRHCHPRAPINIPSVAARTYPRSWTSATPTPSRRPSSLASASPYLASLRPRPSRRGARRCPSSLRSRYPRPRPTASPAIPASARRYDPSVRNVLSPA